MNPYGFQLENQICVGDKIVIQYKAPTTYPQFSINLLDEHNDIILHFNPRYEEGDVNNYKKLVLNNCINGKWQKEVWTILTEDLRGKQEMIIDAQSHAFVITAADGKVYEFPMRISVTTCKRINIVNGTFISVEVKKPVPSEYFTVAKYP